MKKNLINNPFLYAFVISLTINTVLLYERPATRSLAEIGIKGIQACLADYNKLRISYDTIVEVIQTKCTCR